MQAFDRESILGEWRDNNKNYVHYRQKPKAFTIGSSAMLRCKPYAAVFNISLCNSVFTLLASEPLTSLHNNYFQHLVKPPVQFPLRLVYD